MNKTNRLESLSLVTHIAVDQIKRDTFCQFFIKSYVVGTH